MDQTSSRIPYAASLPAEAPAAAADDDPELVQALRRGDPRAPQRLVERYSDLVFGIAYSMLRHRQDAEDVTQDTFLRALRSIAGFDAARPLRPWLLSIAANRCRTALQQRAKRPVLSDRLELEPEPPRDSSRPAELVEELSRALGHLRPEYRMVFILFHEQNLPYEEIGLAMDRPVGTVKTWLHRARADLARQLIRRGLNPPS